jgi:hypothetical protein
VPAAINEGLINSNFAAALQAALSRSGGEGALLGDAGRSEEEERNS